MIGISRFSFRLRRGRRTSMSDEAAAAGAAVLDRVSDEEAAEADRDPDDADDAAALAVGLGFQEVKRGDLGFFPVGGNPGSLIEAPPVEGDGVSEVDVVLVDDDLLAID
jgi:hypothetical protein